MGESRQELVNWVNSLLDLSITKVEQCGTGAIYCQLLDTIYMDVPMSKVKFNVNTEYQYLNNFKVLQLCFTKHRIERPIPVERLVKCRFQDNLEFLQWFKKYWEANFSGQEYDPNARRKGQPTAGGPTPVARSQPSVSATGAGSSTGGSSSRNSSTRPTSARTSTAATRSSHGNGGVEPRKPGSHSSTGYAAPAAGGPASRKSGTPGGNGVRNVSGSTTAAAAAGPAPRATMAALQEAREHAAALEQENEVMTKDFELVRKESLFYFDKLRDIELLALTASKLIAERKQDLKGEDPNGFPDPLDPNTITADMKALGITEQDTANTPELALLNIEYFLNEVQNILYSTTEGFERPDPEDQDQMLEGYDQEPMELEETF